MRTPFKIRSRTRRLYDAIVALSDNRKRADAEAELLSPIDRHVLYSRLYDKGGLFHPSYHEWRLKRCNKILEIYGLDYFRGKKVIELGAGHGDIGALFADLGAQVLCLDGRPQTINFARLKHRKVANLRFEQCNLENDFSHFGRFDLAINFGLIYHLKNVDSHLKCCFATANELVTETVVCDSTDPNRIHFCDEEKEWKLIEGVDESALEGTGSLPSPFYVERIARESGFEVTRHFTADLNAGSFRYDWEHQNDDRLGDNLKLRRFWQFSKSVRPSAI